MSCVFGNRSKQKKFSSYHW